MRRRRPWTKPTVCVLSYCRVAFVEVCQAPNAASNSASIEQMALQAGMKKGGAAKGELVLAIFELANCFRHGWGIEKDAYAAKQVR